MFGNMGRMMKLAAEMRQKLPEIKAQLEASTYEASAGGGAVTVTVNGKLALVDVKIAPRLLEAEDFDLQMLEDMIKAAAAIAQDKAAQAGNDAMKELTGGLQLPGMDELMA